MAAEIVNPVPVEDVEPWMRQLATTLLGNPYDADFPRRVLRRQRSWRPGRTWGARDRGRWVATLATDPRTLTVPGPGTSTRDLVADAVTGVTVSATHRRRGLLTDMIGRSLAAAKDRGDAVSILIAAEWPIYGRFGYAPATQAAGFTFRPRRAGASVPGADPTTVHQIEADEAAPIADAVFEVARRRRAGQVDRHAPWWNRQVGLDGYARLDEGEVHWFVHEGPDGPDGVLAWKATRYPELNTAGTLEVAQFFGVTPQADRDMWGYLSGIDIVDEIGLWPLPADEPARFRPVDGRTLEQREIVDYLWVRLLDVPAALSARAYAADGDLVLDVRDPTSGGYAQARVRLTVSGGAASCEPSDREPDVRLDQRTLASMYLGGFRLHALAQAQQIEQLTPGTIDRLDLMFSTPLAPFTQTGF